jgi:prepilin-type N-terminal cleavage/methylation domain-containing protein
MLTSRPKTQAKSISMISDERAFTLVEIMVVVALIVLIMGIAIPSILNVGRISSNAAIRGIATTLKETYNSTMVKGRVHRVVWDLENSEYWVEEGPATILLDTDESREKEKRRFFGFATDERKPKSKFSQDETITRKKVSLPTGIKFEDVRNESARDPIKSGVAYTHFFPHGVAEQTVIHIKDTQDRSTSLIVSSLMGKTILKEGHITLEEAFGQKR